MAIKPVGLSRTNVRRRRRESANLLFISVLVTTNNVEGYKDCDKKLRQALAHEMAERNASTEFAGAVRTVPNDEVQEDDDVVDLAEEGTLEFDSH